MIFKLYTDGTGTNEVCRALEKEGYLTGRKKSKWYNSSVESILTNEKYCGDLLIQKSVTVDFLKQKRVKNDGNIHLDRKIKPEDLHYKVVMI